MGYQDLWSLYRDHFPVTRRLIYLNHAAVVPLSRPGDRMVAFREEFPANFFPWKRLEGRGVSFEWLSIDHPLEAIDRACRGARLLAISVVQYLSGCRADLEAIGEICHRHGCLFFVDAIQGLGAFPLDIRKARIHALAADGHKWRTGCPRHCRRRPDQPFPR